MWQSPPPPRALSESTIPIHETNHSLASWQQHLTAVVAMGVLPCDHPRRGGQGGKATLSNTLRSAGSPAFDHAEDFVYFIAIIEAIIRIKLNKPLLFG